MSIFTIWFKSSQRRECHAAQHADQNTTYQHACEPPNPVLTWLKSLLGYPADTCPVDFGAYNARKRIVEDVHAHMEEASGDSILEWHPKRIWQEYYRLLPGTRPARGYRTRRKGHDVVYVPRHDDIKARLDDIRAKARGRFRF